ncbi:MAG: hypothetical protein JWM59_4975 [Verrucomicrobiales bacterium]|nr:hypothetical protein [Verrucomicrobiales bacterium]
MSLSSDPPSANQRPVRTYARREDAEQAKAALADHNIEARIEEFRIARPGTQEKVSAGCQLSVRAVDAANAARVLMRMPPTETAEGPPKEDPEAISPSRLKRRIGPPRRQKSPAGIILIAILCSGAAMFWLVNSLMRSRSKPQMTQVDDPENYLIEEDTNFDGATDVWREYSPTVKGVPGKLLSVMEDRDYDGKVDLRWVWQRGLLMYRDRDLDHDGVMDERTTFDGADQPFYVDLRVKGKGPVIRRQVYREGVLWKILEDMDSDTHFDHIREYDPDGSPVRDEPLPKNSPENHVPKPEALPAGDLHQDAVKIQPKPAASGG